MTTGGSNIDISDGYGFLNTAYTKFRTSDGFIKISGTTTDDTTRELFRWTNIDGSEYTQQMIISKNGEPSPDSVLINDFIHTAEYDNTGRAHTQTHGTFEGTDMTDGSVFTVKGYTWTKTDPPSCSVLDAEVNSKSTFRYRNPFWETSIHEHHLLEPRGYPASNLDYSQYKYDAIPLEVGSDLHLAGYRWETIKITHELDRVASSEFHCTDKNMSYRTAGSRRIPQLHRQYASTKVTQSTHRGRASTPGVDDQLDDGEAFFSVSAKNSDEIRITATMWNLGREVAKGYNTTYQFVPTYAPMVSTLSVTNTALGGDHSMDRPVSTVMQYNGTPVRHTALLRGRRRV